MKKLMVITMTAMFLSSYLSTLAFALVGSTGRTKADAIDIASVQVQSASSVSEAGKSTVNSCTVSYSVGTGGLLYLEPTTINLASSSSQAASSSQTESSSQAESSSQPASASQAVPYQATGSLQSVPGTSYLVSAVANSGYALKSLLVNGVAFTNGSSLTVTANTTIAATFEVPVNTNTITQSFLPSLSLSGSELSSSEESSSLPSSSEVSSSEASSSEASSSESSSSEASSSEATSSEASSSEVSSSESTSSESSSSGSSSVSSTQTYQITYSIPENGILSVKDSGGSSIASGSQVAQSTSVTVTATPSEGYTLSSLTVNGETFTSGNSFIMQKETVVAAAFVKETKSYPVTFSESSAYGSIQVSAGNTALSTGETVAENTQLTIKATPKDGYAFVSYKIDGKTYTDATTTYTVTGATSITATFAQKSMLRALLGSPAATTYPVQIATVANALLTARGVISGVTTTLTEGNTYTVDAGTQLAVTVKPDPGYVVKNISAGGSTISKNTNQTASQTFTVTADTTVSASIEKISYSGSTGDITRPVAVCDDDGDSLENNEGDDFNLYNCSSNGRLTLDGVLPNQTFYIKLGDTADDVTSILSGGVNTAKASQLVDSDLFRLSTDKDGDGKSLIKSITQIGDKRLNGDGARGSYLKVILKDSDTTTDLKAKVELKFKAKRTLDASNGDKGTWSSGEYATLNLTMWINNTKITGSDGDADTGDSVYFSPEANEVNTFVWGDDRAALEFTADDDADDFYARLSTKADVDVYTDYGDPVDADLWFYNFIGNPTVPSTSRAVLTLGVPWDNDDDHAPNPKRCYIYELDSDGDLSDVTERFTYTEDSYAVDGWTVRTRVLGTYIVSDTELDLDTEEYVVEVEDPQDTTAADDYEDLVKVNPSTGNEGYFYTPVTVPAATTKTDTDDTDAELVAVEDPVTNQKDHNVKKPEPATTDTVDKGQTEKSSFPWVGLLATLVILTSGSAAGYLVYRLVRSGK